MPNSVDPNEMPHNAAFNRDMTCLLRQNWSSEKEIYYFLEAVTPARPPSAVDSESDYWSRGLEFDLGPQIYVEIMKYFLQSFSSLCCLKKGKLTCLVRQSVVSPTADPGKVSSIQALSHTFVEIDWNRN